MNWNDITVEQFQAVRKLQETKMDEFDRLSQVLSVLYGYSPEEVDELPVHEYAALAGGIKFLTEDEIPGKVKKYIRIGARKYYLHIAPSKIKHRQFVEIQHFSNDIIGNLHNILASICCPVKWFVVKGNKASDHSNYAEDFKKEKLVDVYHACLFFCRVYAVSLRATADYLLRTMPDKEQAFHTWELLNDSARDMDGYIQPKR